MERTGTRRQRSESFLVAALLAAAGGFLDAYTYLCRGHVFANAQTGNLVLLAVRAAEGRWRAAAAYLAPVLAFALGVVVAETIKRRYPGAGRLHWRHFVLLVEVVTLASVSGIPLGAWDSAANILVSFVCALQVETFRKVRGNPFASTMCTGNLRSGTEALYQGAVNRNRALAARGGCYFGIMGCFLLGAALGGVLTARFSQWAVLAAAVCQLAAFWLMCGETSEPKTAKNCRM